MDLTIGEKIRIRRKEKGLTQQELADRVGCSLNTISRYENGTRIPPFPMLEKMSDALTVPLIYFESGLIFSKEELELRFQKSWDEIEKKIENDVDLGTLHSLNEDETRILSMYDSLSDSARKMFIEFLIFLTSKEEYRRDINGDE